MGLLLDSFQKEIIKERPSVSGGGGVLWRSFQEEPRRIETISSAPEPSFFQRMMNPISSLFEKTPEEKTAEALNILGISETTKLPISRVSREKERLFREPSVTGIRPSQPTRGEFVGGLATIPIVAGLATHPLTTLAGVGTFAGLSEIENQIVSRIKKTPSIVGGGNEFIDLLPEDLNEATRGFLEIAELLGKGAITGGVIKGGKAILPKLTKDVSIKYNLPKKVYISYQDLVDVTRGVKEGPDQILSDAGVMQAVKSQLKAGVKNIEVEIPAEKITTLTDKPYWAKIKSVLRIRPSQPKISVEQAGKPFGRPAILGLPSPEAMVTKEIIPPHLRPISVLPTTQEAVPKVSPPSQVTPPTLLKQPEKAPVSVRKPPLDAQGNELIDLDGNPVEVNPDGTITLYHRTSPEAVVELKKTGRFKSLENTNETFFSNKEEGQAEGYGNAIVAVKVKPSVVRLNDAFHNGEIHVTVSNKALTKASIITETSLEQPPITTPQPVEPTKIISEPQPTVSPVTGTGETKTRGLSLGVQEKAIENKLTSGFGELPEFQQVNMKDQAQKASALITSNPDLARRISMGEAAPPPDILPESIFVAVEDRAISQGDVNTLLDLAVNSKLTQEATTMGQRIKTLSMRDPESPVAAIKDISRAREGAVKKRVKDVSKAKKQISDTIRQDIARMRPSKETWASFVQSLECK